MHSSPRTPLIDPQLTAWVKDRAQAVVVYRRVALYTFLTVMMGVTGVLLIWPRTYHSQAKLFVRLGRESVALDPTVTTGATIALSDTREHEINSVMEMIRNRAVFEDVVRVLGAEVILGDSAVPDMAVVDQRISEAFISPAMTTLATGRPTPEVEKAIRTLESIVTSEIAKRSSVIHLTCEASSPELAQTILKVFLAAFQSQHVQAHRTDQSLPFFEGQAELLRRELEQATKQLVSAKNEAGVVSLEVRRQATEDDLTQLGRQVQESRAQLTALEATLKNLQEQSQELPQLQTAEEIYGQPDDVIGTTRRTLYDLQIRERDLLTRYTPRHPLVNATRQQITQAELLLAGTSSTPLAETKRIPNPAWQQVRLQLLTTETEAAAVRGKAEKLEQQLASLKADRKQLNQLDGHIRQLQQQVDVLQASYGAYLDRREQARVVRALERERISNVNVIQPASYVSQPIAPKRGLILVLCVFVSACAGIGLALMVAAFSLPHEHREEPRGVLASNDRPESNEGCDHEIENTAKLVAAARY